jgi:hypothetical protein
MRVARAAELRLPPVVALRRFDTVRLIPARYAMDDTTILMALTSDASQLQDVQDLDSATDTQLQGEHDQLAGIGIDELVFGVPNARIINSAYTYARPEGSRFNDGQRGAWYGSFTTRAALQEVIFHKTIEYAEINRFDDSVKVQALLADFNSGFHDLRGQAAFADCLDGSSYVTSQILALDLLDAGSMGIVYPSARYRGGTNLVCFRPALVGNVRRALSWRLSWDGSPVPRVSKA